MPMKNLWEAEKDIVFEWGFYKGVTVSIAQHDFLRETFVQPINKKKKNPRARLTREQEKLYDELFNQPYKRR